MSVIIRLQNLPWSANATDIRQFFKGLSIPDGGVHIVGGENGDAFIAFSTDDDARKAMRLDQGKLKEIQVRLFLSSRAEMQEVIETARQTTMSLMQMQRPAAVQAPIVAPAAVLTPQSPPQAALAAAAAAAAMQTNTMMPSKLPPTLPVQMPGLITQQMYQQQIQQLQQQQTGLTAVNGLPPSKTSDAQLDLVSSRRSNTRRSTRSRSYSRSRSRSRSPSSRSRDRYRRRSRSPRRNKGRSHRSDRDRSDSRDRDSRRRNRSSRNDKDSGRSSIDKRSSVEAETKPMNTAIPPNQMNPMNPMYQQNVPFNSNITQFMMKQMNSNGNNVAGVAAAAAAGAVGAGVGMPNMAQNEQMSAFSTNDVRTMNMNMTMQTNPLAFQQHMFNQQPPPTANMPPFNAFAQPPNSMGGNLPPQLAVAAAAGMGGVASSATGGNKFGGSHVAHNGNGNGGPAGNHHNMSHKITCCVRVRNLCNLTNYSAIRKFFAGLLIPNDGIKMINDMDGNRTGQAYVRFARPNFVMQAIQRSNQKLGRNVIQIQELDEKTYDEAIDSYRPPRRNHNNNNSGNNYRSDHDRNDNRDRDREYRSGGRNSRFKRNSRDYSDDDDDDDDRTSSRGSRGSCGNSDNEHDNDVMCISDSNDSKDSAPFTTVLIEDLPPFTKEQDIMKLFSSYPLVHIVMAKRSKMFSSYVRFHSADDAKAAVKNTACHKISFKTVYISACSEEEFETARKEFSGELDLDIGRPPMKSVEENRSSAMDKNDSSDIKSPDTTTLQNDDYATEESNEMTSNAQSSSMDMSAAAAPSSSSSSSSVPMHGISLESIPGINLADPRINASKFPFLAAAAGAAGSASSSTEMENKHSTPTNERIDPRTRAAVQPPMHNNNAFNNFDMMQQQQQQHQQGGPAQHQSQFQPAGGMMDPSMSEVCCILIENMEYRTTEAEIVDWIQHKCNLVPIRIQLLVNDRNQTNGNGFIQFASNAQAVQAMERLDKAQFKSRVVHISLAPWPQIMMTIQQLTQVLRENGFDGIDTSGNQPRSRFNNNNNNGNRFQNNRFNNGNNGGGGGGNNGRMNNRPNNRNGNNSQMSGNVVSMSNVPYKASIEDILDFFSDFDMTPEDIIRRYNDEGKPTGDLRVRFESPAEARRAIDLKDKCRLANRPVYLQLFNY